MCGQAESAVSGLRLERHNKVPIGTDRGDARCSGSIQDIGSVAAEFLWRHIAGDWGDVDEHDRKENELILRKSQTWRLGMAQKQFRIRSAYTLKDGTKIWIITEADRSMTTLSLLEEY